MALIPSDHGIIIVIILITHRRGLSKTISHAEMRLLLKTLFICNQLLYV